MRREAPDVIVIGGDIAAPGPMPRETLERVMALGESARCIRGNTDRELVEHCDGTSALPKDDVWARRGAWAAERIGAAQRDFLAALTATVAFDVEGLGPTLFCHGSPRSDEEIVTRATPAERLDAALAGVAERVVVCGHTHVQFDRTHRGTRVVNAGSVGMHWEGRPGAYWLLLGPTVEPRCTTYDVEAAARRIRATGYPEPDELVARLTAHDPSLAAEATARFERVASDAARRRSSPGAVTTRLGGPR